MPAKRRFRRPSTPLHPGHRAVIAVITVIAVLGLGAAPVLAGTGSVYVDTNVNTAAGFQFFNGTFTGQDNVGIGNDVMPSLTTGNFNVATGEGALTLTTSGDANAASGYHALHFNTTGHDNAASGTDALAANTTGSRNVALGSGAGLNITTGSHNVDIANQGGAGESGTIRIGSVAQTRTFLAGVAGKTIAGPTQAVVVDSAGRLGTAPAPAAPLSGKSQTLSWLRDTVRQQGAAIQRLRQRMQNGG